MKLETHIKLEEVGTKKLLATVLSLQIAVWTLMGLNVLGISIPIVQPLVGLVYLTFVPGILMLAALRLRNLGVVETALYAVGLSITVVMAIGLVNTIVFNAVNVMKPLSSLAVTSSVSFVVLVLCAIAYLRNRTHPKPLFNIEMSVPLAPTLFLIILPFITVFSTYLVNSYNVNVGQFALYLILGAVVLLIAFDKFVPSKLYPLAVFVIALSLLFQQTLISAWLTGWDIQTEWSLANSILNAGVWNPSLLNQYDGMLSLVSVAPIYSIISSLDLVWVFKIVYPAIFALVPLGLYQIYRRQLDDKTAFLSCFFFMSIVTFFTEMTALGRQEVAEFFFVLLILLLVSKEMNKTMQSALFVVFSLSLVVSHYGLTYIVVLFFFVMWLVLTVAPVGRSKPSKPTRSYLLTEIGIRKDNRIIAPSPESPPRSPITILYVVLFFIGAFAWYAYTAQATLLQIFASSGNQILTSIGNLFDPTYSEAVSTAVAQAHPSHNAILHLVLYGANALIYYLIQFFIIAGVCLAIFLKKHRFKFQIPYVVLSTIALVYVFAAVAVPYFSAFLTWPRVYQIASILLAPFLAVGFIKIGETISATMSKDKSKRRIGNSTMVNPRRLTRLLAIFLVLFMLFQTNFFFALTEGVQTIALSNTIDDAQFNHQEVVGVSWLANKSGGQGIYGDVYKARLIGAFTPAQDNILPDPQSTLAAGYIFLGTYNIEHNQAEILNVIGVNRDWYYINVTPLISNRSLIYSNGGANAYS